MEVEVAVERVGIGDGVSAGIGVMISTEVDTTKDGRSGGSTTATWSETIGKVYGIQKETGRNKGASPCALILDGNCEVS